MQPEVPLGADAQMSDFGHLTLESRDGNLQALSILVVSIVESYQMICFTVVLENLINFLSAKETD